MDSNTSLLSSSVCSRTWSHPFTCLIAGPTGCGKTFWVRSLLSSSLIQPPPKHVLWCYGQYQPAYDEMLAQFPKGWIRFQSGLPTELDITQFSGEPSIVILDDLMQQASNEPAITKMFVQGSHHRNMSVIWIVQNVFFKGSQMRTISLNSHYMVLFKNPRDQTQVRSLSVQMYPGNCRVLQEAYKEATKRPYGYLCINCKPDVDERCRLQTNVFEEFGQPSQVFVPVKMN